MGKAGGVKVEERQQGEPQASRQPEADDGGRSGRGPVGIRGVLLGDERRELLPPASAAVLRSARRPATPRSGYRSAADPHADTSVEASGPMAGTLLRAAWAKAHPAARQPLIPGRTTWARTKPQHSRGIGIKQSMRKGRSQEGCTGMNALSTIYSDHNISIGSLELDHGRRLSDTTEPGNSRCNVDPQGSSFASGSSCARPRAASKCVCPINMRDGFLSEGMGRWQDHRDLQR